MLIHSDGVRFPPKLNHHDFPRLTRQNQIEEIYEGESDINPYGATNTQEFFAVTTEYFFERPLLMKRKHPELHDILEKVFGQKMSERDMAKTSVDIGRNNPCPCGSGLKYKKCCGKKA